MDNTRKFNATITTRFDQGHKKLYKQTLKIINDLGVSKSKGSMLLIERGVEHTNNPRPLITPDPKPKVVVKKEVVYKDKPPIEKVVYKDRTIYKDRPEQEHLTEHIPGQPSLKSVATQDTPQETPTSTGSGWIWCIVGGILAIGGWKLASLYK